MKMTDFRRRVLAILSDGPLRPEDLGERLWPNAKAGGPSRGGPSYVACAASWQLGKMRHETKWVQTEFGLGARWYITDAGQAAFRKDSKKGQSRKASP